MTLGKVINVYNKVDVLQICTHKLKSNEALSFHLIRFDPEKASFFATRCQRLINAFMGSS